jgi:hypothetical protein
LFEEDLLVWRAKPNCISPEITVDLLEKTNFRENSKIIAEMFDEAA